MKKVLFFYNPTSGETAIADALDEVIGIYQSEGLLMVPYRLGFTGRDEEVLRQVDATYHHILVAGGDGTVNYLVNLMKRAGVDMPLAVLPTGTANDFAHLLGVPDDIPQACRQILNGEVRPVDLGLAGDTWFVNVFSCGLFTEVSQRTPTIMKNTFGKLAYYVGGLNELPKFRKMQIEIESDSGAYRGSSLIFFVFNGQSAGQFHLAYKSEIDDGLLDVLVVKGDNPLETLQTVFHYLSRRKRAYPPGVVHMQCRSLRISAQNSETTDIDGQPGPGLPVTIRCMHQAIRVLAPRRLPL